MSTMTKHISLDFYTTNIVNIYAKQADANSRFVNVTCTDHGKKVEMRKSDMSAFIRVKKNDNTVVYNDAVINDDGTITFELTQQMLAVTGRQTADITILHNPNVTLQEFTSLKSIDDLTDIAVISVMSFNLIVAESAVDNNEITSSNEFDALITATARMQNLESTVRIAENSRVLSEVDRRDNEDTRISNENTRQSNENSRKSAETTRVNQEKARVEAEKKRQDDVTGEAYRITNEESRQKNESERATTMTNNINDWNTAVTNTISKCNTDVASKISELESHVSTAVSNAEAATVAANKAATDFEAIKDQSGIIMQEEKGSANGIATLDENGMVPSSQLNIANNLTTTTTGMLLDASQGNQLRLSIEDLQDVISSLQVVHFNSTVDNSIGKNGDILMVPLS